MFILNTAWRDSRRMRRRLFLFVASMALGVAALVAIRSFGANVEASVTAQARELFGADLEIESRQPFTDGSAVLIDSVLAAFPGRQASEASFASMALFPAPERDSLAGGTRLVNVRAVEGAFPLYGSIETTPGDALSRFQEQDEALVAASLLLQYGVEVGDSVQVGQRTYRIAGRVDGVTGQTDMAELVGPRVYLPYQNLDQALLTAGSRVDYARYLAFDGAEADEGLPERAREAFAASFRARNLDVETLASVEQEWSEALGDLGRYLELVGFVALLLGGLGVASAVHVYIRQKLDTVATLRCLGATGGQALAVYALQAAAMGLAGATLGAVLGVGVQYLLPAVLGAFLPVDVEIALVWPAVFQGLAVGLGVALLFALLPLLAVRRVPPLRAIRSDAVPVSARRDPWRWLALGVLVAAVVGFAYVQLGSWRNAAFFVGGTAAALGALTLAAAAVRAVARRLVPRGASYTLRQGLANLYRPGNQTLVLLLTLGLGTFLILTLLLTEHVLLDRVSVPDDDARPDLILFDIQADQQDGIAALVEENGVEVLEQTPLVTMRLRAIDGRSVEEIRQDSAALNYDARWALRHEYRSTYRSELTDTEELVEGRFVGEVPADAEVIPITFEDELARDLRIGVGARLSWDVQGVPMETEIAGLRRVDWARPQLNFFAVFPDGPLDDAPRFGTLTARAGSDEASARVQRAVVRAYPNVSVVDVGMVIGLIERIFDRVAFVLQFMALFTIGTGLVVLAGAVLVARLQRIQEAVLLRTLGASRPQVRRIFVAEYALLGLLAAITGGVLALGAAWAIARYAFLLTTFEIGWASLIGVLIGVPLLTVAIGLAGSRGLLERPPLDVLRGEG
ncbi:MAG: FtsX-like permease family protein [Bacteroidota bacterium]